jgi:threonine dehydrogenase-like Zn-dependent dehydrogenase
MRALCWHGKGDVRVDTVPDPKIQHPRDAIIKIAARAICGSDLHLFLKRWPFDHRRSGLDDPFSDFFIESVRGTYIACHYRRG